eukprot:gene18800-biopygen16001
MVLPKFGGLRLGLLPPPPVLGPCTRPCRDRARLARMMFLVMLFPKFPRRGRRGGVICIPQAPQWPVVMAAAVAAVRAASPCETLVGKLWLVDWSNDALGAPPGGRLAETVENVHPLRRASDKFWGRTPRCMRRSAR